MTSVSPITEVEHQIAGLLGDPAGGRVRRDTQNMDTTRGVLDHGEAVQPGEQNRRCMEEVGCQDPFRLGFEELGPCRVAAAGCRVESGLLQDRPYAPGPPMTAGEWRSGGGGS
jgi:hypothetical protein